MIENLPTYDVFHAPDRDVAIYRITFHNGDVEEFEVTGQARASWFCQNRPEIEALPQGERLSLAFILRLRDAVGTMKQTLAPKRARISPMVLAREMWETDSEILSLVAKRSEGQGVAYARTFSIAWGRDELGKRAEYIRRAHTMLDKGGRDLFR